MQKHLKKICSVCLSFTLLLAFGGCSSEKAKGQMKAIAVSRQSIPTRRKGRMKKWKTKQQARRR